jgi:hypothetical protein
MEIKIFQLIVYILLGAWWLHMAQYSILKVQNNPHNQTGPGEIMSKVQRAGDN